jgi:redox-sensitive bicupin YhaK (pirin superfamily)
MYDGLLEAGERTSHNLPPLRRTYLQVARGNVQANEVWLGAGDGAAIENENRLDLKAQSDSEVLLFDLP